MSRGLGTLQRAIMDALPAHELARYPGVYDLKKLRVALSQAMGKGYYIRGPQSRERNVWYVDSAFAAGFSRAVRTLLQREILSHARGLDANPFGGTWDAHRWRLPYVHRTDKR